MLDTGSGGPTRYLTHAVEWNNRRWAAARSTVVVARDIGLSTPTDQLFRVILDQRWDGPSFRVREKVYHNIEYALGWYV